MSPSNLAPSLLNTLMTQHIKAGLSVDQALAQIEAQAKSGDLDATIDSYDRALVAIASGIRAAAERAVEG